jgi:hypothetical protein
VTWDIDVDFSRELVVASCVPAPCFSDLELLLAAGCGSELRIAYEVRPTCDHCDGGSPKYAAVRAPATLAEVTVEVSELPPPACN